MKKSSEAAKDLAKKKAKRTDAAGRSGMGESARSNVTYKGSTSSGFGSNMAADKTAMDAANKSGVPIPRMVSNKAYQNSLDNARKYDGDRTQANNPRRDSRGRGNAGFGK